MVFQNMAKLCGVLSAMLVDDMVKVWWRKGSQTMKEEFHSMGVRFLPPPGAGGQPVFDTPYVMSKPQWWLYGDGACRTKECLLLCAFSNYGLSKNCKMEAVLFKPWSRFLCTEATYMSKAKAVNSPMVMNKVVQRNRSERLTCFLLYISIGAMYPVPSRSLHIHVVGTLQCAGKSFHREKIPWPF